MKTTPLRDHSAQRFFLFVTSALAPSKEKVAQKLVGIQAVGSWEAACSLFLLVKG
jgi:hypothetical protein